MKYKKDIEITKKRLEAFWENGLYDRCTAQLYVHWDKNKQMRARGYPFHGNDSADFWTDADNIMARYRDYFENSIFMAEAIPSIFVNLGPGSLAAYLGSAVVLGKDTVWFDKLINFENNPVIFDRNNKWWQLTKHLTQQILQQGEDEFYPIISDLGGVMDVQGHLRGVNELLLACACDAENVYEKEKVIMDVWKDCYLELCYDLKCQTNGMMNWLYIWAPGSTYCLQSDLSCNISNDMFREMFLPRIYEQCQYIQYPLYHLDGAQAIKHLDGILQIEQIKAIQWEPGYGGGEPITHLDLLKRIQKSNKSLVISIKPSDISLAKKELSPEGLCLRVSCGNTEEAEIVLESIEKW